MPLIMGVADRIVAMESGAVIADGTPDAGDARRPRARVVPRRRHHSGRALRETHTIENEGARMSTSLRVVDLQVEHLVDPVIDTPTPRLSWRLLTPRNGASQAAYHIRVAGLWDSGRVESATCTLVPYGGPPLTSGQRVEWTVQVWDDSEETAESSVATWEMGLLGADEWTARVDRRTGRAGAAGRYIPDLDADACGADREGARVRHGPRALRAALQRPTRRYRPAHAGLDRLRDPIAVPSARPHRPSRRKATTTSTALLADGWYAGYVGFTVSASCTATRRSSSRKSRSTQPPVRCAT